MIKLPNHVKAELETLKLFLKNKPHKNLIEGYKNAMKTYEETGEEKHKHAAIIIKSELKSRGIEVE